MPQSTGPPLKRPRISLDVSPEVRRHLRMAAAKHGLTVRQYVLEAVQARLRQDLSDDSEAMLALTARADPVLAEIWDTPKDSARDHL